MNFVNETYDLGLFCGKSPVILAYLCVCTGGDEEQDFEAVVK